MEIHREISLKRFGFRLIMLINFKTLNLKTQKNTSDYGKRNF